jgi:hypothetical protein
VRDVNLERVGAELSGWIILLAALAMAADWMVANRFYAPRAAEGQGTVAAIADSFAGPVPGATGPLPPAVPPAVPPVGPPVGPPPVPPPVPMQRVG